MNNSSQDGFQEYVFHTNFTMGKVYKVVDAYGLSCYLDFSKLSMCEEFDEFPLSDVEEISESDISEAEWDEVMEDMDAGELSELKEMLTDTPEELELPEFEPDAEFYENLENTEPEESDLDTMLKEVDTRQAELEEMLEDTGESEEDEGWQKVLTR